MEIKNTHDWFVVSGQMPAKPVCNVRQTAFYTGMQVEELAEKLTALFPNNPSVTELEHLGHALKRGTLDATVRTALRTPEVAKAMLDADMDLVWVSAGAAYSMGADAEAAYGAVATANWAKFPDGVVTRDPQTGKVIKPEGWHPPDLSKFVPTPDQVDAA